MSIIMNTHTIQVCDEKALSYMKLYADVVQVQVSASHYKGKNFSCLSTSVKEVGFHLYLYQGIIII